MNTHLKIFLTAGIPFGVLMGVFYSLRSGFPAGLIDGLFAGLFFGGIISILLGTFHTQSVKEITSKKSKEAMRFYHVRNIELRLPY
jgi:hypothetical protein